MDKRKIFLGILLSFAFLATMPVEAAQQAETPDLQVGDTWALGTRNVNLGPLFYPFARATGAVALAPLAIQAAGAYPPIEMDIHLDYTTTGALDIYRLYQVDKIENQEYKMSIAGAAKAEGTAGAAVTLGPLNGWGTTEISVTSVISGSACFSQEKLALRRMDFVENSVIWMSSTIEGDKLGGGKLEPSAASENTDFSFQMNMDFDPALDIFDFPISVNENWTAEASVTVSGTYSGKRITTIDNDTTEVLVDGTIDNTFDFSMSLNCTGTTPIELADGSVVTCYKIEYLSTARLDSLYLGSTRGTFYYSPDEGFIVKSDELLSLGNSGVAAETIGKLSKDLQTAMAENEEIQFSMGAVSAQEARNFIQGGGEAEAIIPDEGVEAWIIAAISLAVLIAAIIGGVVIRRRRREETLEWE